MSARCGTKVLPPNDPKFKEIDAGLKNKFKWTWLLESCNVDDEQLQFDCFSKVEVPGKVLCTVCDDLINYSSSGKKALHSHIKLPKHMKKWRMQQQNMKIAVSNEKEIVAVPPPNVQRIVPLCDRVANSQAMVLGVIAEHSLPLSMSPVLIDLAKGLAKDPRALQELTMDRTSASYKLTFGLQKTFLEMMVADLQRTPFSLNIDEATSKTNVRVLAVIVTYFSPDVGNLVVNHLAAIEVTTVSAQSLFDAMTGLFDKLELPWENLVSILMDSCAVMRGTKTGLETRLREQKAPHLLDIDGDSCHHVHNAAKKLCAPFGGWTEKLLNDLHTDLKWSVEQREKLAEVSALIGLHFARPERYVPHRWLSTYDVSVQTLRMWDAFIIFYYPFIQENRRGYKDGLLKIMTKRDVPEAAMKQIKEIHTELEVKYKNFTEDGKKRKERIITRLFFEQQKTQLHLRFYTAVMPILKNYVLLFQSKDPLVHRLHSAQEDSFREFLSLFLKPECLVNTEGLSLSGGKMKKLNLSDRDAFLSQPFIGSEAKGILDDLKAKKNTQLVSAFQDQVRQAYLDCGTYLQSKLPLSSQTLRTLSCLDPDLRGCENLLRYLLRLPKLLPTVSMTPEEATEFELEAHRYSSDMSLPMFVEGQRVDKWWHLVAKMNKFPNLCKFALAALTPFHGPQVESSFNVMGDILHAKSSNTSVKTYESYQCVKYHLRSVGKTAVQYFSRPDAKFSPVAPPQLCRNVKLASKRYRKSLDEQRQQLEQQRKIQRASKQKLESKAAGKATLQSQAAKQRKAFIVRKLAKLAAQRKAKAN